MQDEDITRRDEVDGTVLAMVDMTWDEILAADWHRKAGRI